MKPTVYRWVMDFYGKARVAHAIENIESTHTLCGLGLFTDTGKGRAGKGSLFHRTPNRLRGERHCRRCEDIASARRKRKPEDR